MRQFDPMYTEPVELMSLEDIRAELDWLIDARNTSPPSFDDERRYDRLAQRERDLLKAPPAT